MLRDGFGEAECIECGSWSVRLMMPHIPHICSTCLFPPRKADKDEDRIGEMPAEMRAHGRSILQDLTAALPKHGPSWSRMTLGGGL